MATRELDRWLLNKGPYPEQALSTGSLSRTEPETVQPANTSEPIVTTKSVDAIKCFCKLKAERVGAQDDCDVYVCPDKHISRFLVGRGARYRWTD